jgi:hypothetical protein
MKTIWVVVAILGSRGAFAESFSGFNPFPNVAKQAVAEVWSELARCGLMRVSAFDPRLPGPAVPAQDAILSPEGALLAYYTENFDFGAYAEFKAPNGGMKHWVGMNQRSIHFSTPYLGNVAHANSFAAGARPEIHFYCQSRPVYGNFFAECIRGLWVKTITNQLCLYGNRSYSVN